MGIIIAIIVGGVAGWLASIVMRRDASMGIRLNVVVGVIGALLGNWLLAPLLGFGGSSQEFDPGSFAVATPGPIILLAIVNPGQRGRGRQANADNSHEEGAVPRTRCRPNFVYDNLLLVGGSARFIESLI